MSVKFRLLTLLIFTLFAVCIAAWLTYVPQPGTNQVYYRPRGKNKLIIFKIVDAKYNIHVEDGQHLLTLTCVAAEQISPPREFDFIPWVEVSLLFDSDPSEYIVAGAVFPVVVSEKSLGTLSGVSYTSVFDSLNDGTVKIHSVSEEHVEATIRGTDGSNGESLVEFRARFVRSSDMGRSFS